MNNLKKILVVFILSTFLWAFSHFNLSQYLSLEYLKGQQANFSTFYKENALLAIGAYTGVYILSTALSLPGAALLTLLGGALFGLVTCRDDNSGFICQYYRSNPCLSCLTFITPRFCSR